jgi:hypothetical protein
MKYLAGIALTVALLIAAYVTWSTYHVAPQEPLPAACTEEAMLCPDGSVVGRVGQDCHFAACPQAPATTTSAHSSQDLTMSVGQTATVGDLTVTFNALVQDSRCPVDVQCIQAGSVVVSVTLRSGTTTETTNLASDALPHGFTKNMISIVDVMPRAESRKTILQQAYRLTFRVESL